MTSLFWPTPSVIPCCECGGSSFVRKFLFWKAVCPLCDGAGFVLHPHQAKCLNHLPQLFTGKPTSEWNAWMEVAGPEASERYQMN